MRYETKIAVGLSVVAGFLGAVGCGADFDRADKQAGVKMQAPDMQEGQFYNNPGPQVVWEAMAKAQAERVAREAFDRQSRIEYAAMKIAQVQVTN